MFAHNLLSAATEPNQIMSRQTAGLILLVALFALPVVIFLALVVISWVAGTAGIKDDNEAWVYNRLGRWQTKLGKRYNFRLPFINRRVTVDLRERQFDLPQQNEILQGVEIDFNGTAYWRVIDPYYVVTQFGDYVSSAEQMIKKGVAEFVRSCRPDEFIYNDLTLNQRLVEYVGTSLQQSGFLLTRFGFENRGVPDVVTNTLAGAYTSGARSRASLERLRLLDEQEWPEYLARARQQLGAEASDEQVRTHALELFRMCTVYDGPGSGASPGFNINEGS